MQFKKQCTRLRCRSRLLHILALFQYLCRHRFGQKKKTHTFSSSNVREKKGAQVSLEMPMKLVLNMTKVTHKIKTNKKIKNCKTKTIVFR